MMRAHHEKTINLALQGGGSHGAFTWGVLDRLFEDDRLWIEAISGTSAGAMNAVVAAQGMALGQAPGARAALEAFWKEVARAGMGSPIRRSPVDMALGVWSMDRSPGYLMMDMIGRVASPYDLNPSGLNPLRDLVERFIDFDLIHRADDLHIYVSATNVETGKVRVFDNKEVTLDAVMASACIPTLFQAVEIDGEHYWDGGFMGNPVLFPFIDHSPSDDILLVQINPVIRRGVPRSAREIQDRVNEITFNASLLRELATIDLVHRMLEAGQCSDDQFRRLNLHMIEAGDALLGLGASSKLNAEWAFLRHLFSIGRDAADAWLKGNYDAIGARSTLNLREMFDDTGLGVR